MTDSFYIFPKLPFIDHFGREKGSPLNTSLQIFYQRSITLPFLQIFFEIEKVA